MGAIRPLLFAGALALASVGAVGEARAQAARHVDAAPDESFNEYVPGAARLEGRLLAPCCWDASRQTLDIHGSPIANELRREIRHRLKAGETPDAIEADLVRRYTTKILAVPPDNPLPRVGTILAIGLLGAGGAAATLIARWRRRAREGLQPQMAGDGPSDEWDERLDEELGSDD